MEFLSALNEDDIRLFVEFLEIFVGSSEVNVSLSLEEDRLKAFLYNEFNIGGYLEFDPISVWESGKENPNVSSFWIAYLLHLFGNDYERYLYKALQEKVNDNVYVVTPATAHKKVIETCINLAKNVYDFKKNKYLKIFIKNCRMTGEEIFNDIPRKNLTR